jgi:predicted nuclease with TOPRIM domain
VITTTKAIEKRRRENAKLGAAIAKCAAPLKLPERSVEDEKLINELIGVKVQLELTNSRQAEYIKSLEAQKADLQEKNWKLQVHYETTHEVKEELKNALRNISSANSY